MSNQSDKGSVGETKDSAFHTALVAGTTNALLPELCMIVEQYARPRLTWQGTTQTNIFIADTPTSPGRVTRSPDQLLVSFSQSTDPLGVQRAEAIQTMAQLAEFGERFEIQLSTSRALAFTFATTGVHINPGSSIGSWPISGTKSFFVKLFPEREGFFQIMITSSEALPSLSFVKANRHLVICARAGTQSWELQTLGTMMS